MVIRIERVTFGIIAIANVALVAALPIIPGHDLPQHLAYARILEGQRDPFVASTYTTDLSDRYSTMHRALAAAARVVSLDVATHLVYAAYALAVLFAFAWLVRGVHGRAGNTTALIGTMLVWNPIVCMGFLPFMVCLPAFLFGVGAAARFARSGRALDAFAIAVATLVLGFVHVVAMALLLAFLALLAVSRRKRPFVAFALALVAALAILVRPSPSIATFTLRDVIAGLAWTSKGEKANLVLATVFGPFPHRTRFFVEAVAFALAALVAVVRVRERASHEHARRFTRAVVMFAVLALFVPASFRVPDDLSYLDFRMFVFAFAVALAAAPPRWFRAPVASLALTASMMLYGACWARHLMGASSEIEQAVSLVSRLEQTDRLLALSFHDRSAFFDESNDMNHYAGVYHTAMTGGVTSLFWGKFARHLPAGYREGREPQHPPDWRPGDFTEAQILDATHVLVSWPDARDGALSRKGAERLRAITMLHELECKGRYCLYAVIQSTARESSLPLRD